MKLFPARKPYQSGYFPVSDGHTLFYALYGNQKGIPVLFVHGGPGAGTSKDAHRYFNPKIFNILTIDQRGAGKSKPYAELKNNTTQKLVEDFSQFLKFLKIKQVYLFGGSWGSCLSLCFAIKYPQKVLGMVLRGIYLGGQSENDFMLKGVTRSHFPDAWERFVSVVPKKFKENPAPYYWQMMNAKNEKNALKYCAEWALFEQSMLTLEVDFKKARSHVGGKKSKAIAKLEALYMLNNCFLPDKYIMKHAKRIKHIPTVLVHGRYDFVCEPRVAYELHKALPRSKLHFVTGGHSMRDPAVRSLLMESIHMMVKK